MTATTMSRSKSSSLGWRSWRRQGAGKVLGGGGKAGGRQEILGIKLSATLSS
jgi:hypothetical protein